MTAAGLRRARGKHVKPPGGSSPPADYIPTTVPGPENRGERSVGLALAPSIEWSRTGSQLLPSRHGYGRQRTNRWALASCPCRRSENPKRQKVAALGVFVTIIVRLGRMKVGRCDAEGAPEGVPELASAPRPEPMPPPSRAAREPRPELLRQAEEVFAERTQSYHAGSRR